MKKMISVIRPIQLLALLAVFSMVACGDTPAPPTQQSKVVSKKISVEPTQPAESKKSPTLSGDANLPTAEKAEQEPSDGTEAASTDLVQASLEAASTYDAKGRFDPFEPLFKEEPEAPEVVTTKSKRKRRVAQTPLERVALSQLKLSAIIRAPSGNRALVEDATGKGYVVVNGTYIGLNSGRVIEIDSDRIVIEEEIENVLGELTVQNSELKLQKPAGEL